MRESWPPHSLQCQLYSLITAQVEHSRFLACKDVTCLAKINFGRQHVKQGSAGQTSLLSHYPDKVICHVKRSTKTLSFVQYALSVISHLSPCLKSSSSCTAVSAPILIYILQSWNAMRWAHRGTTTHACSFHSKGQTYCFSKEASKPHLTVWFLLCAFLVPATSLHCSVEDKHQQATAGIAMAVLQPGFWKKFTASKSPTIRRYSYRFIGQIAKRSGISFSQTLFAHMLMPPAILRAFWYSVSQGSLQKMTGSSMWQIFCNRDAHL